MFINNKFTIFAPLKRYTFYRRKAWYFTHFSSIKCDSVEFRFVVGTDCSYMSGTDTRLILDTLCKQVDEYLIEWAGNIHPSLDVSDQAPCHLTLLLFYRKQHTVYLLCSSLPIYQFTKCVFEVLPFLICSPWAGPPPLSLMVRMRIGFGNIW